MSVDILYMDYLGNVRLSYLKNGASLEIVEENNYYPFGLQHKGYNNVVTSTNPAQNYKYNGKEWQNELDINLYDYGARNYMPDLGRYFNMDRFSEAYVDLNPYQYTANNPVKFIDVNGDYIYIWDENTKYRYENGEVQKQNENGKWESHQAKEGSYLSQVLGFLGDITGGDENSFGSQFLALFANDDVNVDIRKNPKEEKNVHHLGTSLYFI